MAPETSRASKLRVRARFRVGDARLRSDQLFCETAAQVSMTLQQLRYFIAACRHGSFSAAADSLYLAQPSLAEQVRRLEGELGVKLFVRAGRGLTLTDAGRLLLPYAENILATVEQAAASVKDTRELRGGTASLGTFGVAFRYMVQEVVTEFVAKYPEVSVRVVGQNTVEVVEKIREGELEAGLITLPIDEQGLEIEPVMSDENLIAATGFADRRPVTIKDLTEMQFIVYDAHFGWQDPTRLRLMRRAREAGLELKPAIEVENMESALALAAKGLGATYVLKTVTETAWFPETLSLVGLEQPLYDTFAFVWRKDAQLSPATQELVRLTRLQMATYGRPALPPPDDLVESGARDTD